MFFFIFGIVVSKSVLPRWLVRGNRHLPGLVGATHGGTSWRSIASPRMPHTLAKISSMRGSGYWSTLSCGLTVTLKSPQMRTEPSFLGIGTQPAWPSHCAKLSPVSCIAEPSVERQSQLRRRWRSTRLVQDTSVSGGMVANRFGLLVLCFADWFFFSTEVRTKDL